MPADDRRIIALVAHRLAHPEPSGIGRYVVELINALGRADPPGVGFLAASLREPDHPHWLPANVPHRTIGGLRKARVVAWSLTGRPSTYRALPEADLVHVLHPWAPVPTRVPLVVTLHDVMTLLEPSWFGRAERWASRRALEDVKERAVAIIAVSARTAEVGSEVAGLPMDRMRVVHHGIGEEFRNRPDAQTRDAICARYGVEPGRYLVMVGGPSERKNVRVVLRALAHADPTLLGTPALLVAGADGPGAAAVREEVDRLGLGPRVRFAGFVTDDDLPVLVGASLALVHPSLDEGFGLPPIEAMAAGVPAIVSDAGSLPEVAGEAAVYCDPHDADAWAAAITALATDPDHRARLIDAGDAHQDGFRWERAARQVLDVYDEVLGRPRPAAPG